MAGINPATGRFDPYYYGPSASSPSSPPPGGYAVGERNNVQRTTTYNPSTQTFQNLVTSYNIPNPGGSWSGSQAPAAGPAAPGGPASGPAAPAGPSAEELYYQRIQLQQQAAVRDSLTSLFNSYGLSGLYGKIVEWAKQDYSAETIVLMLRQTQEYKQRFPAMEELAKKGRGISEADYIGYERTAAAYEQAYGLPQGMLMNNVGKLLLSDVSVQELEDRVQLAAAASITAPEDFKAEMRDRFGINQGALTAYYLDPDTALPLLEKQYAMAVIGTEARRQGVEGISTDFLGLLQNQGVTQDQAKANFGEVAYAEGLSVGAGETATTMDLAESAFGTSADATRKVQRVAGSRKARFQGGGGYTGGREGLTGIGVSST